eukprot:6321437-Prymnesium_polylepis.2
MRCVHLVQRTRRAFESRQAQARVGLRWSALESPAGRSRAQHEPRKPPAQVGAAPQRVDSRLCTSQNEPFGTQGEHSLEQQLSERDEGRDEKERGDAEIPPARADVLVAEAAARSRTTEPAAQPMTCCFEPLAPPALRRVPLSPSGSRWWRDRWWRDRWWRGRCRWWRGRWCGHW